MAVGRVLTLILFSRDPLMAVVMPEDVSVFELVASSRLERDELVAAIKHVSGGLHAQRFTDESFNATVGFDFHDSHDPKWPTVVCVSTDRPPLSLDIGPLLLAEYLWHHKWINSITDTCGLIADLDPQDPYWALAYVDGQWYFADTFGIALDGLYDNGNAKIAEFSDLKLLLPLYLKNPVRDMYNAHDVGIPQRNG